MLNINRIVKQSRANGHGVRYTIWMQGCNRRCPGCFNPETQPHKARNMAEVKTLIRDVLSTPGIEGITLSGGEPLLQAKELAILAQAVQAAGMTVMMFTGFSKLPNSPDVKNLLRHTDMVIAGEYDQTKPGKIPLIGSSNQKVINITNRIPNPLKDRTIPRVEIIQDGTEVSLSGFPTHKEVKEFKKMFGTNKLNNQKIQFSPENKGNFGNKPLIKHITTKTSHVKSRVVKATKRWGDVGRFMWDTLKSEPVDLGTYKGKKKTSVRIVGMYGKKDPWASKVKLTLAQKKAKEAYTFALRQEDRYLGSVFANAHGQKQYEAKTKAAYEVCKRLGMGCEHGM